MVEMTPAEHRAAVELSRLGQQYPTDPLTPAEQAVADVLAEFLRTAPAGVYARRAVAKARPHLYREAAAIVDQMPHELGDEGWAALEQRAVDADWPRESLRRLRNRRDTFANMTVEAAYQHGYREAAKILRAAEVEQEARDGR